MSSLQHLTFIEADRPLSTALESHYALPLVGLSILVAIVAAYTAFLLSERIRASETRMAKLGWSIAGAVALGAGIWAMHFIGILAFILPVTVRYDIAVTAFSLAPAFLASLVVLSDGYSGKAYKWKQLGRGVFMGAGIGLMHYTGMAAMELDALMRYDPFIFALSIIVAVILSLLALRIKHWAELGQSKSFSHQQGIMAASVVMGIAISSMHYTGMAAVRYFPARIEMTKSPDWEPQLLALVIGLVVSGVLILLISAVFVSRRLALMHQLKNSETKLKMIFDTIADGLIISDENGIIQSFNRAAEKIFGYRREEVIGHNVSMLMPEQLRGQHDGYMHHHRETGEAKIIGLGREVQGLRKDGTLFPIDLAVNRTGGGNDVRFVGSIRDISRRRQTEADLAQQHQLLDIIRSAQANFIDNCDPVDFFEGMLPGILSLTDSEFGTISELMHDEHGQPYLKAYALNNIAWNAETREFYEKHAEQGLEFHNLDNLLGQVVLSGEPVISNDPANDPRSGGLPPDHPPIYAFLGIPVYLGKQLVGMIAMTNRPGGYDGEVVKCLRPVVSTCAQLLGALGRERERQRTTAELEQARQEDATLSELMRQALEPSNVRDFLDTCLGTLLSAVSWLGTESSGAIFLTTNQGKGNALRQAAEHNLAPGLYSLCARVPFGKCLCGRAAAERTVQFAHCIDERHETCYEGMVPHGHYCLPLLQNDTMLGVLMLELSHGHKESETEIDFLERATETIGMGISRRYAVRDLREAKEAAEAAARAKSQFLATMSHEIRTPMNGVLGMLHLLGKTGLATKQQRYLETAAGSGELLLTVINDILDYSKLEAGKLELESIPFDPMTLAEETVALMAKGAHEKGLELICSVQADTPRMVRGDPTRLRQVLTNLVSNALKFTEEGDIVLYIAPAGEDNILFGVRDTGIGIPEKEQQHLFKAFTQADSSHTRKYGGTGLGLAICQQLVLTMSGSIQVTSTPGEGSDFSFKVPLERLENAHLHEPGQARNLLMQQRILVVDDNLTNREVLAGLLNTWQVSCVGEAGGATAALQQLHTAAEAGKPFTIALLDMQMPGVTGLELARTIRADKGLDGLHLLMLSSVDCQDASPELDVWLTKPVRQSDLYNMLLLVLGQTATEESSAITPAGNDETCWFGGSKLLLVEDNYVNQEVAKEILADAGFQVDVRENGFDALQAVQEHDYDIVLMDVQMPVMDGLEATRQIRALGGHFTDLPIIAMTAHALSGDSDKSIAAGMNAHLTKPIEPENVFRTVANWITPTQKDVSNTCESANGQKTDTETTALPDDLPDALPGIDIADGLARLRGNQTAYRRILIGFRDKQADAAERIEGFIHQGQRDAAMNLAHTLKGSGGNLGATRLYSDAAALEQACRAADTGAMQTGLTALRASLAEVISGLAQINQQDVAAVEPPDTNNPIDSGTIDTLLENILHFLDNDLGEAQASLANLKQQAAGSQYTAQLIELENALNNFDIDTARDIAEALRPQALC